MKKIRLVDGTMYDLTNAVEATEYAAGKTRQVLSLELPETYTAEQLAAVFGDEDNAATLVIGGETEDGTVEWYSPAHRYYNILLACGYESVEVGTHPETAAPQYERKLTVRLGKRTPEEIEIYDLRHNVIDLEAAIAELAYGGEQ